MSVDLDALERGVAEGRRADLARAITLIESTNPEHERAAQELLVRILPRTGNAHRIGISGVPGVGKSTFIEAFGCRLVDEGRRVAVLAVDPSSARTRGSILGDKTRMGQLAMREASFIRPSPASGTLGGVARRTREAMLLCEAAGYDIVLVETVGVGQSETAVAGMVDFFLVLMLAGAGDELQGIKRGIMELADALAVNKADGENTAPAERARQRYEQALHTMTPVSPHWAPRVLTCSALQGTGLDAIWDTIAEHRRALEAVGAFLPRRERQALQWMWSLVDEGLHTAVRHNPEVRALLPRLEADVQAGRTTATLAAKQVLEAFT